MGGGYRHFVEPAWVDVVQIPPAPAGYEVLNGFLRPDALVEMFVAAEHHMHAVARQRRLERRPNHVAALGRVLTRRVQRMVEEADAPLLGRVDERVVEPLDLRRIRW